ncbi:conserved phage C-terminal domain-containing protein [Limosilactobacillus reuteri]|uniref:conserved phage C-terminal domain-containing protein n=1 Tax=Limosilactobacillus reuteri TaxID=1598 RepID=UPI002349539B|nr:conserved phage C-terminal domain-containing protein [Limosilactobacillus reuteri]MDC6077075.1 conserved phage C-terminal domain-containing protein [Limosilactobacillus reuteri]
MGKLLIDEQPLQCQPSLAIALGGSDEAIVLQQLHYWLERSSQVRDGYRWVYNSMADWHKQFPWIKSRKTLSGYFKDLEKRGLIVTGNYNQKAFDKTKWYRIDYDALSDLEQSLSDSGKRLGKNYPTNGKELPNGDGKNYPKDVVKTTQPIPLDYQETTHKNTTRDNKGPAQPDMTLAAQRREVIDYLNEKTGKHFKPNADGNRRVIDPRLKEGYTVAELKRVIDIKYSKWHGITFQNGQIGDDYLRPETLFRPSKIDGYLNESMDSGNVRNQYTNYRNRQPIKEPMPAWWDKQQEQEKQGESGQQGSWMDQLPD